jgi:hypothetical protein
MKDIENNSNAIFTDITVLEGSKLNVITSNSLSLFGLSGKVRITAAPSTANYNLTLPNSIGVSGQLLATDGIGSSYWVTAGGGGGGSGTVTSVSVTVPPILSVSGNPITTSGTIAITTATAPTGSGAIVLKTKPEISNPTIRSVFEDGDFGEGYVGIAALSPEIAASGFNSRNYFGIDQQNCIVLSTLVNGPDLYNSIIGGQSYLNLQRVGTFESLKFTQNIPSNYFEFGTEQITAQSDARFISENVSFKDIFSDETKPSVLITNRSSGFSRLAKVTAGSSGQVLTVQVDGSLNFSTPTPGGGGVTSVGVSVPSILSVSGSPITTSGTIAITTATAPTGSGAIVLKTQPSIQNPTITNAFDGIYYIGINALDSTVPDNTDYFHFFGRDTLDDRNYLRLSTSSSASFKGGALSVDTLFLNFNHRISNNSREIALSVDDVDSKILLSRNDTTDISTMDLISGVIRLSSAFSVTSKTSLLTTTRISGFSNIAAIPSGTTGQVLTTLAGGGLGFATPTSGGVTSVGLTVPSILSVSGAPITTSGTIAITTATTPTGSGAIVLKTQPEIQNPNVTGSDIGGFIVGINALDSTLLEDQTYSHYFGRDTSDFRNYLEITTSSGSVFKNGGFRVGDIGIDFIHNLTQTTKRVKIDVAFNSGIDIVFNSTTNLAKMNIFSDSIRLKPNFSDTSKTSLLTTTRISGESDIQAIPSGTTGQVLTTLAGGGLGFATPTSGSVTSVGLTVPAILSVSGSPITTSGTIAITTATTPTGSGAIVLRTQPSIANPTITSISNIGIRALDSSIPLTESNDHYFGIDTADPLNYLKISTVSTDNSIDDRYSSLKCGNSEVKIGNNQGVDYIKLDADEFHLPLDKSTPGVPSALYTFRDGTLGVSVVQTVPASTPGTVLTTDGAALSFATPGYTTQTVTAKIKGTIYQNTTLKPRFVNIILRPAVNNETFTIQCDTVTPPVIKISESSLFSNDYSFSFIVLPNYYYRVTSSNIGGPTYWVEWD